MRFNLHIYFLLLCWAPRVKMMFAYLLFVAYLLGHEKIARKEKYEHAEFVSFRKVEAAVRPIKITAGRT